MKHSVVGAVIPGLAVMCGHLIAQPYRLDKPQPMGAHLFRLKVNQY